MRIFTLEQGTKDIDWNALVRSLSEGTVYQTIYWGNYIRKINGVNPVFLIAQDDSGKVIGSLLAYESPVFMKTLKYGSFGKLLYKIINKKKLIMTWLYGPLVYDKDRFDEVFNSLIEKIEIIAKEKRALFLKDFSLPMHGNEIYNRQGNLILSSRGYKSREFATIFIDLSKEINFLWHNLKNSARKAIKKSLTCGIEIKLLGPEGLNEYYNLLYESRKRVGVALPPAYPNRAIWEELGQEREILLVFTVNRDGRLLGAIGILNFNGIIFEIGPAQSDYSFKNKIYVNDILKWHIIKNGKYQGARLYDLCGISLNPKNEKEKSLNQFKEKWGGEKVFYKYYSKFLW